MLESLLELLTANDDDLKTQGISLLANLEPLSDAELTTALTEIINECTIKDKQLQLSNWFSRFDYTMRTYVALYILHYLQSPLRLQWTLINLSVMGRHLPPMPFVEELRLALNNRQENCTDFFDLDGLEYPNLHTLQLNGQYGRTGILQIPLIPAPNLESLEIAWPWLLDGLQDCVSAYPKLNAFTIYCQNNEIRSGYNYVCRYMGEHQIAVPSLDDWYDSLQGFLKQCSLSTLNIYSVIQTGFERLSIPQSIQFLDLSGSIHSIEKLFGLTQLSTLYLDAPLQNAAQLLSLPQLQQVSLGNTSFLPPLLPIWKSLKDKSLNEEQWQRLLFELQSYLDIAQNGVDSLVQDGKLQMGYNNLLTNLQGFENEDVEELNLDWTDNLCTLDGLKMPNLKKISLRGAHDLDFSALKNCPSLEILDLTNSDLHSLSTLPTLNNLHTILLDNSNTITLGKIDLPALQHFSAEESICLKDIDALKTAHQLKFLNLNHCVCIDDFSAISQCQTLKEIHVQSTMMREFPDISHCTQLEVLKVKHSTYLKGFAGLPKCGVTELDLSWCACFEDSTSLQPLEKLRYLNFAWCRFLKDIESLKSFTQLETVIFWKNDALPLDLPHYHLRGSDIQQVLRQQELLLEGRQHIAQWKEDLKNEDLETIHRILDDILQYPKSIIHQLLEGCSIDNSALHAWEGFDSPYKDSILFQLFSKSAHPDFLEAKVLVMHNAEGLKTLNGIEQAGGLQAILIASSTTLTDISALGKLYKFRRGLDNAFIRPQLFLHNLPNVTDFSCLEDMQAMEMELWKLPHLKDGSQFGKMTGGYGLMKLRVVDCGVEDMGDLSTLKYLQELQIGQCPNLLSLGIQHCEKEIAQFDFKHCPNLTTLEGLKIVQPHLTEFEIKNMPNLSSLNGLPDGLKSLKIENQASMNFDALLQIKRSFITDFTALQSMDQLEHLSIKQNKIAIPTQFLTALTNLQELHLENNHFGGSICGGSSDDVFDLKMLNSSHLQKISITASKFTGLEALHNLQDLKKLTLLDKPNNIFALTTRQIKELLLQIRGASPQNEDYTHEYDMQTVGNISPLAHRTVATLKLSSISSSDDLSALSHLHRDNLSGSFSLATQGSTLQMSLFISEQWPEIPLCTGVDHFIIGDKDATHSKEMILDLNPLSCFPELQSLEIYNCPKISDLSIIGQLTELQVLKFKNAFAGTCFSPDGLMGITSVLHPKGILVTQILGPHQQNGFEIDDIIIAHQNTPMSQHSDFPTVPVGQSTSFTVLREDQEIEVTLQYHDVREFQSGKHEWLIYGRTLIQQFVEAVVTPEKSTQVIVWITNNDELNIQIVIEFLVTHFSYDAQKALSMGRNISERAIVAILDPNQDVQHIIDSAPEGLEVGFCSISKFAIHM